MARRAAGPPISRFIGVLCCATVLLLCRAPPLGAQRFELGIDDVVAPDFAMHGVKSTLVVGPRNALTLAIDRITVLGQAWRDARLHCPDLKTVGSELRCADGMLDVGERIPLAFAYDIRKKTIDAVLMPGEGERWHFRADFGGPASRIELSVERGRIVRLARWMPSGLPPMKGGTMTGTFTAAGGRSVTADVSAEGLSFSDAAGLRAGENIGVRLGLEANRRDSGWAWSARGTWQAGEMYWHPVYLKADAQRLVANGRLGGDRIVVDSAEAGLPGLGTVVARDVVWDIPTRRLDQAAVQAEDLPVTGVYERWLKPFLAGTALADLRTSGELSFFAGMRDGRLETAELKLAHVFLEDRGRRFALFDVSGGLPWRRGLPADAAITIAGGEMLRLPFGRLELPMRLTEGGVRVERIGVPLLGGELTVSDFEAGPTDAGWRWRFRGALSPVPMEGLTQHLGLPVMHGTLSGVIPEVAYDKSTLSLGGALVFNVFDGAVTARNVTLSDPFGRVPRLTMDLDMQRLDLDLLTRTFSFGSMTGRVDAAIGALELVNWSPARFDARIVSSPGDYPRSISQTAVQNISALGGAGAAAAIQRSILRFFDRFGYEKLGLSCKLRNNVCEMGGIEDAPQGYVIVKGGGIPALSVIGYNRQVNWPELVGRLRRIMQENVHAVIR